MARKGQWVLDSFIDALSWSEALGRIREWSAARESRYVCICNVHSVVTAQQDPEFGEVINGADMATPDGMPVAWALRHLGFPGQGRINGPDLMWQYCADAERTGAAVFFYGSAPETLAALERALRAAFPALKMSLYSPPFRALTAEEDAAVVKRIRDSGAGVVFVGLGCPKQERWMAEHRGRVPAVMIGVGAAFDYHAGLVRRAPPWMQRAGLEWLHRLSSEPRRLWRRYLTTNTRYVLAITQQLLAHRRDRGNTLANRPAATIKPEGEA